MKHLYNPRLRHDAAFSIAYFVAQHLVDNYGYAPDQGKEISSLVYVAAKAAMDKAEDLAQRERQRLEG